MPRGRCPMRLEGCGPYCVCVGGRCKPTCTDMALSYGVSPDSSRCLGTATVHIAISSLAWCLPATVGGGGCNRRWRGLWPHAYDLGVALARLPKPGGRSPVPCPLQAPVPPRSAGCGQAQRPSPRGHRPFPPRCRAQQRLGHGLGRQGQYSGLGERGPLMLEQVGHSVRRRRLG